MFQMGNRALSPKALLATLCLAAACTSQAMIRKPVLEEAPASFFRVTADYTVIETGEAISFDYVVGCGGIVANYSYTTPSAIYEAHPTIQILPTQNGAAIGIKAPGILCDQRYFEFVPDDFRPFMMWFPDVEDLSFSWGYATEVAYESPNAHVIFHGSNVTQATESEWRDNRAQLSENYKQVGALPGPWGYSFSRGAQQETIRAALLGKKRGIAEICHGYSRLKLPTWLVEEFFELSPAGTGRYWLMDNATYSPLWTRLRRDDIKINGRAFNDHLKSTWGTVQREGGGTIATNFNYDALTEVYPVLPIRQSMEAEGGELNSPKEQYFRTVLYGADWDGFSACGSGWDRTVKPSRPQRAWSQEEFIEAAGGVDLSPPFDPEAANKPHWLDLNEVRIGENPERQPGLPWILDREGYLFFDNGWGLQSHS